MGRRLFLWLASAFIFYNFNVIWGGGALKEANQKHDNGSSSSHGGSGSLNKLKHSIVPQRGFLDTENHAPATTSAVSIVRQRGLGDTENHPPATTSAMMSNISGIPGSVLQHTIIPPSQRGYPHRSHLTPLDETLAGNKRLFCNTSDIPGSVLRQNIFPSAQRAYPPLPNLTTLEETLAGAERMLCNTSGIPGPIIRQNIIPSSQRACPNSPHLTALEGTFGGAERPSCNTSGLLGSVIPQNMISFSQRASHRPSHITALEATERLRCNTSGMPGSVLPQSIIPSLLRGCPRPRHLTAMESIERLVIAFCRGLYDPEDQRRNTSAMLAGSVLPLNFIPPSQGACPLPPHLTESEATQRLAADTRRVPGFHHMPQSSVPYPLPPLYSGFIASTVKAMFPSPQMQSAGHGNRPSEPDGGSSRNRPPIRIYNFLALEETRDSAFASSSRQPDEEDDDSELDLTLRL